MEFPSGLFAKISDSLPVKTSTITGGSINNCYAVTFKNGSECFVKHNLISENEHMFEVEASGLKTMRQAGVDCPEVIDCRTWQNDQYLILSFHKKQSANTIQWEDAGKMLAKMHQSSSPLFGLDYDNYMGSLVQSNSKTSTFHEFFILERLEPQIKLARDTSVLFPKHAAQFAKLFDKLENLIPKEKPALVHGDLWSGNFHPSAEGILLIDPAIAYSHREVDLAMSTLFGAIPESFYRGYQAEFKTEHNPEERYPIYNLYPLLIHLNLFGASYRADIESILGRFV